MSKPVVHLFHLGVDTPNLAAFYQAGDYNLTRSYEDEDGTLAMYVSAITDNPRAFKVLEIYADDTAYQTHRHSRQFQAYVEQVGHHLTQRKAYQTEVLLLEENITSGIWLGEEHFFVMFTQVDVKEGCQEIFEKSVLANLQGASECLARYVLRDIEHPKRYYFYEVYADETTYAKYQKNERFKNYLAETKALIVEKKLIPLDNSIAFSKGGLTFPK